MLLRHRGSVQMMCSHSCPLVSVCVRRIPGAQQSKAIQNIYIKKNRTFSHYFCPLCEGASSALVLLMRWCFVDFCRCKKWVENCSRSDLKDKAPEHLNKYHRLCARHFEPDLILKTASSSRCISIWSRSLWVRFPQNDQVQDASLSPDHHVCVDARLNFTLE